MLLKWSYVNENILFRKIPTTNFTSGVEANKLLYTIYIYSKKGQTLNL